MCNHLPICSSPLVRTGAWGATRGHGTATVRNGALRQATAMASTVQAMEITEKIMSVVMRKSWFPSMRQRRIAKLLA